MLDMDTHGYIYFKTEVVVFNNDEICRCTMLHVQYCRDEIVMWLIVMFWIS